MKKHLLFTVERLKSIVIEEEETKNRFFEVYECLKVFSNNENFGYFTHVQMKKSFTSEFHIWIFFSCESLGMRTTNTIPN